MLRRPLASQQEYRAAKVPDEDLRWWYACIRTRVNGYQTERSLLWRVGGGIPVFIAQLLTQHFFLGKLIQPGLEFRTTGLTFPRCLYSPDALPRGNLCLGSRMVEKRGVSVPWICFRGLWWGWGHERLSPRPKLGCCIGPRCMMQ